MANFGIGLGSFLSGAVQGAQAYAGIQDARSRQKLNDLRVKEAESDLAEKTRLQDQQADANRIGKVGIEEGQALYGDDVKKVIDHFNTKTVPKLQQFWIENGKIDQAETLGKFMQTKQAQQLTEASAQAIRLATMGDYGNLGPAVENLLNASASVTGSGGYKLKGLTEVTDDKGQKTGGVKFNFTDSNGKDQEISFNSNDELIGFIRNNAMPDKIVEYAYQEQEKAQKVRAEAAKDRREFQQDLAKQEAGFRFDVKKSEIASVQRQNERTHGGNVDVSVAARKAVVDDAFGTGTKSEGSKKIEQAEAAAAYLKRYGYTDEQIRTYIPSLLGVQNNSKPMASRLEETIKTLSQSDTRFAGLSMKEKVQRARELIDEIDGAGGSDSGTVANPFQGGNSGGIGLQPYQNTKTGAVEYR